ncbi:MAG: substrate-binding domain-containing protein [Sphaerochaetaceae bacterium]|nr:substrate-binding domain-containing protein [Sphaerochaetaceae bacterium]
MYTIGIALQFQDTYDQEIARGLIEWARQKPQWRLVGPMGGMRDLSGEAVHDLDAIVVRIEHAADIHKYEKLGIPVIDVAGAFVHDEFYRVQNDDCHTGRLAGKLIRDLGSFSFAYVGAQGTLWSEQRLKGFEQALGISLSHSRVFTRTLTFYKNQSHSAALDRFVASLPIPTAIFCCNDITAVKVTAHLRSRAIEIPRQMSVVSVDDDALLCSLSQPSLTSIALDCRTIGFRSGELIASVIDGTGPSEHTLFIPARAIVERESTQLMLMHDPVVMKALVYIRDYACQGISVEDVAAYIGSSRRNLELRWRRVRDRTILEEITAFRLQRAKRLLRETTSTIESIAHECGFNTAQRLYSLFHRYVGCTPGEWRLAGPL